METNLINLDRIKAAQPLYSIYESKAGPAHKKLEQEIVEKAIERGKTHIRGGPVFKFKLKKALKEASLEGCRMPLPVPVRFFISSDRVKLDSDLGILYINPSFSFSKTKDILKTFFDQAPAKKTYRYQDEHKIDVITTFFRRVNRKIARVSIEQKLQKAVIQIIKTPPLGRVATEDQHFFMVIMRLEMFIKKIAHMIEKNSIISLLQKERELAQKKLFDIKRRQKGDFKNDEAVKIVSRIKIIDAIIYKKRLLVQRRLFDRAQLSIKNWQPSLDGRDPIKTNRIKLLKIEALISVLEDRKKRPGRTKDFSFRKILIGLWEAKIINLKKKLIKYKYLASIYDKQKTFSEKLKNIFMKKYESELIPASFIKSPKAKVFDCLRIFLNLLFLGSYIYFINIPTAFIPLFLLLGLFVFQPIANKFAVLFMSFFTKNSGLKRLSMFELKQEIKRKTKNGQYFCAIDLALYTGKLQEIETTSHYMKKNIANLKNTLKFHDRLAILYQITSNTSDSELIQKEIEKVKNLQAYADHICGKNRIYFLYLHRNRGTAKKIGNIVAAHLLKYHGYTYPVIYTDKDRFVLTFDQKPFFDHALGNFSGSIFGSREKKDAGGQANSKIIQDILEGKRIRIRNRIDFTFFVDNKNDIKIGSLEKALAIMLHPENINIGILQPEMSIEDPISQGHKVTSAFLRMMRFARDIHNVRYLRTLHGLYDNMSAYYGKGMLRLKSYDYMVINEVLNLKYVDSHDWQESVFNHAVLAVSGKKEVNAFKKEGAKKNFHVLIEKKDRSALYGLVFYQDKCIIKDENKDVRTITVNPGLSEEQSIKQVITYLDNGVEVGERELISTIGNYMRDARWLKGDLQMFNTFMPYAGFLPSYHLYHLENIFRRFTNELALCAWVFANFLFALFAPAAGIFGPDVLFALTLYLAVSAFGFAGIDLFLYPIFFESESRIRFGHFGKLKFLSGCFIKIFNRCISGLWQFFIYILIAWPRVFLGIKSSLKVLLSSIDKPLNWGKVSNASLSTEETEKKEIPFKRFFKFYMDSTVIGFALGGVLLMLVISGFVFPSILMPFNVGIIVISFLIGSLTSYLISRKIKVK